MWTVGLGEVAVQEKKNGGLHAKASIHFGSQVWMEKILKKFISASPGTKMKTHQFLLSSCFMCHTQAVVAYLKGQRWLPRRPQWMCDGDRHRKTASAQTPNELFYSLMILLTQNYRLERDP